MNTTSTFLARLTILGGLMSTLLHAVADTNEISARARSPGSDKLISKAIETHTDALIVLDHGTPVVEWYATAPSKIHIMSITKAISCLAVGALVDEGKIKSVDDRISCFYPEWMQGCKKDITVRHILSHTSGLQDVIPTTLELDTDSGRTNLVQFALCAEVEDNPGTRWKYGNKAIGLLSGLVRKASGKSIDAYLDTTVFKSLGIADYSWFKDGTGTPCAWAGLRLLPRDLAKIGQLVLDDGKFAGEQVLSASWMKDMLTPGPVQSPNSKSKTGLIWNVFDEPVGERRLRAFSHGGSLGQYLIVFPDDHVVAVRLISAEHHSQPGDDWDGFDESIVEFISNHGTVSAAQNGR